MTPEGWQKRRIREFSERLKRINTEGLDLEPLSITKDRGVILQSEKYSKRIATDPRKYVFADDGDFAFDPMSLYYGAIGRVGGIGRALVSPDYVVFNADQTVDSDFLLALLRYPEMHKLYESLSETGNTFGKRRRLYWSIFEDIELLLPPLSEQKKIAAILSSVDEAIDATQAVIDQLQVVKKAILAELLTRGLPGRHTRFKQTEIGEVPEEWQVVRLEDVATVDTGFAFKSADFCAPSGPSCPVVRMSDLKAGRLDLSAAAHVPADILADLDRFEVLPGDLLVGLSGSLGNYAEVPDNLDRRVYLNQRVGRLRLKSGHRALLRAWYTSDPVQGRIRELAAGGAQPNVSPNQVRQLHIPRPRAEEDAAIGGAHERFEERLRVEDATLHALRDAKSALMSVLLTGEVRVKPDEEAA